MIINTSKVQDPEKLLDAATMMPIADVIKAQGVEDRIKADEPKLKDFQFEIPDDEIEIG